MSAQLAMDFTAAPAKPHRAAPHASSWKAYAESVARYRTCVRLDLGRVWACEWPWEPGDLAITERMGPERRPCPLCEVRRWATRMIADALHVEIAAENESVESGTYLAWLESDHALMRKVERGAEGNLHGFERLGTLGTALVMAREAGSIEAAFEELRDDAYAMDAVYFDAVGMFLRVLHLPKREATALLHAWAREQEAA
jgi:hypothetical protein